MTILFTIAIIIIMPYYLTLSGYATVGGELAKHTIAHWCKKRLVKLTIKFGYLSCMFATEVTKF